MMRASRNLEAVAGILLTLASIVLTRVSDSYAQPAEKRYLAVFVDGSRREVDMPDVSQAKHALRWLRDQQAPAFRPAETSTGFVEFHGGDRLPGCVVGFAPGDSGEMCFRPPQLLVKPDAPIDLPDDFLPRRPAARNPDPGNRLTSAARDVLRVDARQVRRVVWGSARRRRAKPGTLIDRSDRETAFRSVRWGNEELSVLDADGLQPFAYEDLAEINLPQSDAWPTYMRQLAVLCPNAEARLVKLQTGTGLTVTTSENWLRSTTYQDNRRKTETSFLVAQPSWSERPLWIPLETVRMRREFAPHEVPLTHLRPVAVEQHSTFGGGLSWERDRNVLGKELRSAGRVYGWGFGVHATTSLLFELPAFATSFRGSVGLDAQAGGGGCAQASVQLLDAQTDTDTTLYRSPHLIGSSEVDRVGPIRLAESGDENPRLVLLADSAHHDRPAGADPFDIRDHVNWLEPIVELDRGRLRQEIGRRLPELIPAWRGWEVASDAGGSPVEIGWDESHPKGPRFVPVVNSHARRLVLSTKRSIRGEDRWLRLSVARTSPAAERGSIEIRIDGRPTARMEVEPSDDARPLLLPLESWRGKETELQVTYEPGAEDERIDWRCLAVTERATAVRWHPLEIVAAESQRGTGLSVEQDGTIAADGRLIDVETFQIIAHSTLPQITAFRLETLTDGGLPNGGPGARAGGNFRLSQFRVSTPATRREKITGRFVRVELPGPQRTLNLAEVQVFAGDVNIARQGLASQSSTGSDGVAQRAIDGDTNGYFSAGSCTHTEPWQTDAWWEVDLQQVLPFDRIVIWNRTDNGCVERLKDFHVAVLDERRHIVWVRKGIADPPAPRLTLESSDAVEIPLRSGVASFSQTGHTPAESLDASSRGWSISPQMGRSHAAGFFPAQPVTDHRRGLVFELKNSQFGPGLPARFRLLATADPLPLEAEPIPAIVRTFADGPLPAPTGDRRLPSPYALFDEEGKFSATEQDEPATVSVVESDGFHGPHAVKITPGGRFRSPLEQIVRIRREPAEGEFRYLRFAFRKHGAGRLSLELEQPIVARAVVRYDAGHGGPCYGGAKKIWRPGLPSEWIVSEHDLFAEWGRVDISGLTIGTPDGEYALVDYVYVARSRDDFATIADVPSMAEVNQRARRSLAAPITSQVEHAVVTISVAGRRGTGVIVGRKGLVLTAGHLLVRPGREATIHLADGRTWKAKTLGIARDLDLGVVQMDADAPAGVEMSAAKETPPHRLYVGFASMSGAESGPQIASYIADIAGEERQTFEADFFMPGSLAGGPLFDEHAHLVGVHTVRSPRGNMQFTRVFDLDLADVWRRLTAGEVWGTWLAGSGPVFGVVTTGVAEGCRVDEIVSDSPAAGVGMKVGDIIEQVEGRRVANYLEIGDVLAAKDPGDEVTIKIRRGEEQQTLRLRLAER